MLTKLAPTLWHWHATHPEWKARVESYATRTDERLVLFDPLLPDSDDDHAGVLKELVEIADGRPLAIALTMDYHARSTEQIARRHSGVEVWANTTYSERLGFITHPFSPPAPIAGAARAFPTGREGEVVFWIEDGQALVVGDVFLGSDTDPASLCPPSWLPTGLGHADIRRLLEPITHLPIRHLLLTHGEPILDQGVEHVRRLLAAAPA